MAVKLIELMMFMYGSGIWEVCEFYLSTVTHRTRLALSPRHHRGIEMRILFVIIIYNIIDCGIMANIVDCRSRNTLPSSGTATSITAVGGWASLLTKRDAGEI